MSPKVPMQPLNETCIKGEPNIYAGIVLRIIGHNLSVLELASCIGSSLA